MKRVFANQAGSPRIHLTSPTKKGEVGYRSTIFATPLTKAQKVKINIDESYERFGSALRSSAVIDRIELAKMLRQRRY
jgi:hypothetical protein